MSQTTTAETTAGSTLVHYEVKEGVAYLTLDDPPANTYTHQMMRQLDDAVLKARFDPEVYVLVLTGMGQKFFCAGANISMLQTSDPHFKYYFCLHANETLNRLEQTPKLVIAALNGHTVGGGLEIAMAADLRIAKKDSGKVGLPEVNLGVLPGTGGTQRLARLVGKTRAIELMVTGDLISFERAEELDIINRIFEGDDFLEQVHAFARGFCPPNRASKAVGRIKRSVQSGWEVPFESGLAIERELQQQLFESGDAREGLDAYVNKRKPEFAGK
jgi:enoyl-CoA hydratase/carnithine racemase